MPRPDRPTPMLDDAPAPVRTRLAALWATMVLLYVYVDLLGLYLPGVIDEIRAGVVFEYAITHAWATGALALVSIPIAMVPLSLLLPARAARRLTMVVAVVYVPITLFNALGEDWLGFFGLGIVLELAVLALAVREAWAWPATPTPSVVRGAGRRPAASAPAG